MAKEYICGYPATCEDCGVIDKPLGRTDSNTGNFIQRCQACGYEWVAMTAEDQHEQAESRMEEAQEVINPVLRKFLKSGF